MLWDALGIYTTCRSVSSSYTPCWLRRRSFQLPASELTFFSNSQDALYVRVLFVNVGKLAAVFANVDYAACIDKQPYQVEEVQK